MTSKFKYINIYHGKKKLKIQYDGRINVVLIIVG